MAKSSRKNNPPMVSFRIAESEKPVVDGIVQRACSIWPEADPLEVRMDITACHANGNPLRLGALLNADDFNFIHDVAGISRHLNRDTGQLMNYFSPRFSV